MFLISDPAVAVTRSTDQLGSTGTPFTSDGATVSPRVSEFMTGRQASVRAEAFAKADGTYRDLMSIDMTGYFAAETVTMLAWVPTTAAVGMK